MRYARKNLTKSKITGYRGVIQRRYAKYRIMKEFFHRKEQLRKQLNIRKKISKHAANLSLQQWKTNIKKRLIRKKTQTPSALTRFAQPTVNRNTFQSKWRKKQSKIYF